MHYCYLLRSARDPRRAYVGYAPNVQARLDAHNGKRPGGARATRNYRPWKVVAIVSGFASERAALCFEYAWHFPQKPGLVHGRQQFPAHVLYIKSMKGGYKALRHATKGLIRGGDAGMGQLKGRYLVARGEADAPDIDGRVYIRGKLQIGRFAQVRIVGHTDYDLIAEPA